MKVFTSSGVYILSIERAKFYGLEVLQMTVIKYDSSLTVITSRSEANIFKLT